MSVYMVNATFYVDAMTEQEARDVLAEAIGDYALDHRGDDEAVIESCYIEKVEWTNFRPDRERYQEATA